MGPVSTLDVIEEPESHSPPADIDLLMKEAFSLSMLNSSMVAHDIISAHIPSKRCNISYLFMCVDGFVFMDIDDLDMRHDIIACLKHEISFSSSE